MRIADLPDEAPFAARQARHGSTGTVYSNSGDAALSAPQNISGGQEKNCSRTTGTVGEDQSSQEIEGLNLSVRMHLRRYARRTNAHIRKLANHKEAGEPLGCVA